MVQPTEYTKKILNINHLVYKVVNYVSIGLGVELETVLDWLDILSNYNEVKQALLMFIFIKSAIPFARCWSKNVLLFHLLHDSVSICIDPSSELVEVVIMDSTKEVLLVLIDLIQLTTLFNLVHPNIPMVRCGVHPWAVVNSRASL